MRDKDQIQHTSVYLPKNLHTSLRIASLSQGLSMSELIQRAIIGTWRLETVTQEHQQHRNEVAEGSTSK